MLAFVPIHDSGPWNSTELMKSLTCSTDKPCKKTNILLCTFRG